MATGIKPCSHTAVGHAGWAFRTLQPRGGAPRAGGLVPLPPPASRLPSPPSHSQGNLTQHKALWPELRVTPVTSALQPCHSPFRAFGFSAWETHVSPDRTMACAPCRPLTTRDGPSTTQSPESLLLGCQGHLLGAWATFEGWKGCSGWLMCGQE